MPKNPNVKRVLVIGSGPIVIGQAAEFDYAGTQACRSLKEEGMEVILVNSNPATIMTDGDIADKVYIEPLTARVLEEIIVKEKPDSLLPNMGGQAGLNLGMELAESGFLEENGVKLIGTTAETIRKAEDRLEFKETMEQIGEPVAPSLVVEDVQSGIDFTNTIGYPVVLRPAYTLGGSGGGIARCAVPIVREWTAKGKPTGILRAGQDVTEITAADVGRAAAAGDTLAISIMEDTGRRLGKGLAMLIDILNPERIVIGSIFLRQEAVLRKPMEEVIAREALSCTRRVCEIVPAGLGEQLGDYAALSVAGNLLRQHDKADADGLR